MKTKFGSIIVDGRGKIGGHVASKNRAGSYLRTKVTPVNPRTSFQSAVRNSMSINTKAWRGLYDEDRNTWAAAVADFARSNVFGDKKTLSGFGLYCSINNNLRSINKAVKAQCPVPMSVPTTNVVSLVVDTVGNAINLTMSGAVPANTSMVVRATSPQSAGKSFFKSEYRNLVVVAAAHVALVDLYSDYTTRFGALTQLGMKIALEIFFVDNTSGITSGRATVVSTIV
jgi:hypothetical protein